MLVLMTVALAAANFELPRCIQYCNTTFSNQLTHTPHCNCSSITKKNHILLSEIDTNIRKLFNKSSQEATELQPQQNVPHFDVLYYMLKHKGNIQIQKDPEEIIILKNGTNKNTSEHKNYSCTFADRGKYSLNKIKDLKIVANSLIIERLIISHKFSKKLSNAALVKKHTKQTDFLLQSNNRKKPKRAESKITLSNVTNSNTFSGKEKICEKIITKLESFDKLAQEFFSNNNLPTNSVQLNTLSMLLLHTNITMTTIPPPLLGKNPQVNFTKIYPPVHIKNNVIIKNESYFSYIFYKNKSISVNVLRQDVNNKTALSFKEAKIVNELFNGRDVRKLTRIKQGFSKKELDIDYHDSYSEENVIKRYTKFNNVVPVIQGPKNNLLSTMQHNRSKVRPKIMAANFKNRKTYNESEIPLQKIITKEFRNGTLSSVINGTEILPSNDLIIDYSENSRPRKALKIIMWPA